MSYSDELLDFTPDYAEACFGINAGPASAETSRRRLLQLLVLGRRRKDFGAGSAAPPSALPAAKGPCAPAAGNGGGREACWRQRPYGLQLQGLERQAPLAPAAAGAASLTGVPAAGRAGLQSRPSPGHGGQLHSGPAWAQRRLRLLAVEMYCRLGHRPRRLEHQGQACRQRCRVDEEFQGRCCSAASAARSLRGWHPCSDSAVDS